MVPVSSSVKPYLRINDILGKNDGYVLNSVHNIQLELPPENIVVMYDEGRGDPARQRADQGARSRGDRHKHLPDGV